MRNKYIILSIFLYIAINAWGQQSNCPANGISTHPESFSNPIYDPDNGICEPVYNEFDWTVQYFSTPHYDNNGTNIVESPFYNNNNAFLEHIAWHTQYGGPNYHPEDGWELLSENITETSVGVDFIYFVLYNKFSSIIRVFGAFEQKNQDYNYYVIRLKFPDGSQNMTGLLHPTGELAQPMDKESIGLVHTTFANPLDESRFIMADFPVEYDPCTCLKENDGIAVYFELVEEQDLQLYGRFWALSGTIADIKNTNGTADFFDQSDFLTSVHSDGDGLSQAGTMIYNSLNGLISKYEANAQADTTMQKQLKALKATKVVLDLIAETAEKVPTAEGMIIALAANAIGGYVGYASYRLEKKQDAVQAENKAIGSIAVTQAELTFNGQITQNQSNGVSFNMDLPGNPDNTDNCEEPTYPKYNEVLGRFAVLETPKVEIGTAFDVASTYFNGDRSISHRIKLNTETLKYLFNPAAEVNEANTLIYAGFVIKGINRDNIPGVEYVPSSGYNIDYVSINDGLDSVTFVSQFVHLDCINNLTAELTSIYNGDDYGSELNMWIDTIYEVQLRFIIYYEFNQLDINGVPNKAFQIVTYPLEQVTKPYNDIPTPISNLGGVPIVDSLYIGSNTNYTVQQTIFAWRKVVVDADLTTNPNINVEIIAPEIEIQGGSIGQNIELKSDYFPTSCQTFSQFSGDLTGFCGGESYSAGKPKFSRRTSQNSDSSKSKTSISIPFRSTPNPFTNSFNIEFELEHEGATSLMVFDALGRVVETVVANDNLVAGQHQYQIDGSRLESGIYYVRLQTDDNTQTIKIVKQ